ncbi:MAG: hypothetical protein ABH886_00705 [Candidatus Desantisbacteria bacterium]
MKYNPFPRILNHIGIKVVCLFLAIFLWLYVTSETTMRDYTPPASSQEKTTP